MYLKAPSDFRTRVAESVKCPASSPKFLLNELAPGCQPAPDLPSSFPGSSVSTFNSGENLLTLEPDFNLKSKLVDGAGCLNLVYALRPAYGAACRVLGKNCLLFPVPLAPRSWGFATAIAGILETCTHGSACDPLQCCAWVGPSRVPCLPASVYLKKTTTFVRSVMECEHWKHNVVMQGFPRCGNAINILLIIYLAWRRLVTNKRSFWHSWRRHYPPWDFGRMSIRLWLLCSGAVSNSRILCLTSAPFLSK